LTDAEVIKNLPIRYMEEVFNQRKFDVLDEIFAPNIVEQMRQSNKTFLSAFPDWHGKVEDIVAEGDRVMNLWSGHGTHTMPLMGIPPTGKHVTLQGITLFRVVGVKAVEQWSHFDTLGLMQQLGVVPTPGA